MSCTRRLSLVFFATAFDKTSVDFLEKLGVPFHKIASFELIDIPLLKYISSKGKGLILSTGMGTIQEISDAVQIIKSGKNKDLVLLKCVSDYPADIAELNLQTITDLIKRFNLPVGFSDHSLVYEPDLVAVSLGARLIEKHFTLSRTLQTPDAFFSLEPAEFRLMAEKIRFVEKIIGTVKYGLTKGEKKNLVFRRSLFAVENIEDGGIISPKNVRSIRPGYGLSPKYFQEIIGRATTKRVKKGTPIDWSFIKK